jgi:GT2 family glycosyltransferase
VELRHPVDVVVLTWNDGPLLNRAIESALGSVGVDVRLWVIDNASDPPATVPADPRVRLYRNQKNLGVASGRNQGVRVGQAPFVCLLDSDARLHPNTLGVLAAAVDDDPSIGLVGPVFDDQPPEATGGSVPRLLRMAARVGGRPDDEEEMGPAPADRREVDYVSGACQVFRRQTFNLVGGFDEWYFHGPEDVDFCLRIREAGLRIQQVTSASCEHTPRRRQALSAKGLRNGVPVRWANSVLIGARSRVRGLSTRPATARRASRPTIRR